MTTAQDWPRCRGWIEAAIETSPGLETIDDVERLISTGHYALWAGENCAAITEIAAFAKMRAIVVVHGGGDLAELLDVVEPSICAWGIANGCNMIMGTGRMGWKRVTEKRGYRFGYLTMVKDLSP